MGFVGLVDGLLEELLGLLLFGLGLFQFIDQLGLPLHQQFHFLLGFHGLLTFQLNPPLAKPSILLFPYLPILLQGFPDLSLLLPYCLLPLPYLCLVHVLLHVPLALVRLLDEHPHNRIGLYFSLLFHISLGLFSPLKLFLMEYFHFQVLLELLLVDLRLQLFSDLIFV